MKKIVLQFFIVCFVFYANTSQSQIKPSYKFEKIKPEDFSVMPPASDSNANAIVLADVGSTEFEGNTNGFFTLVYKRHKRILLRNRNAFDAATIMFQLYTYTVQSSDELRDIEATTYTLSNGQITETKLDKSQIFTEKARKNYTNYKFTLPNLTEGCIIDYKYTIRSPYQNNEIRNWAFQGQYPCLWSEYTVSIPSFFNYMVTKQGYLKFTIDSVKKSFNTYSIVDPGDASSSYRVLHISGDDIWARWAIKDVPAFKSESYTTTPDNHISKVKFRLYSIKYSEESNVINILKDWYSKMKDLMNNEDFGKSLTENNGWLKDEVETLTKNTDQLQGARNIWQYVRNNFVTTDNDEIYLTQSLKKTFQTRKGNVADINLLLTAMLMQKNYDVQPVLLSTRDNGYPIETQSFLDQVNYVIARVLIDTTYYLLDATDSRLGFGKLPAKCYNRSGRIVSAQAPLLINLSADSLVEKKNTFCFISSDDKGNMSGNITSTLGYYESYGIRNKLVGTKQEEYTKSLAKSYPTEMEVANITLDSVNNYDDPITVNTEIKFKFDEDIVYFYPMFNEVWKTNPFAAAERAYPVEMDNVIKELYTFTMQVPPGYDVDEIPKSTRVNLNGDEGKFEYIIVKSGNDIQMRCTLALAKANYLPEDYKTLRDFFAYVVKKEAEPIVFKKKK
jgi:hypothetical protein